MEIVRGSLELFSKRVHLRFGVFFVFFDSELTRRFDFIQFLVRRVLFFVDPFFFLLANLLETLFKTFGKRSMPSRQTQRNVSVTQFPRSV